MTKVTVTTDGSKAALVAPWIAVSTSVAVSDLMPRRRRAILSAALRSLTRTPAPTLAASVVSASSRARRLVSTKSLLPTFPADAPHSDLAPPLFRKARSRTLSTPGDGSGLVVAERG